MNLRRSPAPLFAALLWGCSNTGWSAGFDRKPMLEDLVNNVILPTYADVDQGAGDLRSAIGDLADDPTEARLASAQEAWRAARKPWKQSEAFRFGPVQSLKIGESIDWWPAKPENIEEKLAGEDPITLETIETAGTSSKGFMAMEYLLFDSESGNAAVLARLTAEDGGARRRAYLVATAEDMKSKTATLYEAWDPAQGNFAGQLREAGGTSATYGTRKAAVDVIVNRLIFQAEFITGSKLGKPLGKSSGGGPQPDEEESPRSDNSIEDMLDGLRGIASVYDGAYSGRDGLGLGDLVRSKSEPLDASVHARIDGAADAVGAIPFPFRTAITDHPAEANAAYESTRELKRILTTEVVGVLGVTLTFNDNDGD
jgi:uncharacterized protein